MFRKTNAKITSVLISRAIIYQFTENLTSQAFINYSHWSLGLIFLFALACGYISPYTLWVTEFWAQSVNSWLSYGESIKLNVKLFISIQVIVWLIFWKIMVQKLKAFIIASWIRLLSTCIPSQRCIGIIKWLS